MKSIELILELPAGEDGPDDFPDASALARTGYTGKTAGLNGEQFIQLGVVVTTASIGVLRTWLVSRAERLKHARVTWGPKVLEGYSPSEIDRIVSSLSRELDEDRGEDA